MSLSFLDGAQKFADLHPLVNRLYEITEKQPCAYKYIARVFSSVRSNPPKEYNQVTALIHMTLRHPLGELSANEQADLISVLETVYACSQSEFQIIRSDFLELVLFKWSEVYIPNSATAQVHMEPTIRDENANISKYEKHCDFIWHWQDDDPLCFCECKANIYNVINVNKEMSRQGKKVDKIFYMKECYDYLHDHYAAPRMILAAYNEEYEDAKHALESWGMAFFEFMGPRELLAS